MTEKITSTIVTVILGIIAVAVIATIVSKQSDTAKVLKAGGDALSNSLKAALKPVTGGGTSIGSSLMFS